MNFPLRVSKIKNKTEKEIYRLICFDDLRSYILIHDLPKYSRKLGLGKLKGISNKRQKYKITRYSLNKLEFQEKFDWISDRVIRDNFSWSIFISIPSKDNYIVWSFSNKIIAAEFSLQF